MQNAWNRSLTRQSNPNTKSVSPKSFLHQIGIRPIRKKHVAAKREENESFDTMAIEPMDTLFHDEPTALATIGSNFDRVVNSIERVSNVELFKNKPLKRLAELGGGTGLISTWLNVERYAEECVVYDYADNPLKWGRKWADDLNAKGVSFHKKSYCELGSETVKKYDFVFAEYAAPFDFDLQRDAKVEDFLNPSCCPLLRKYRELSAAIKNLTAPGGFAFIGTGVITPVCAVALCYALRECGLVIDWAQSSNRNLFQLLLKTTGLPLLDTFEHEALAIISDLHEMREFEPCDILTVERTFCSGKLYMELVSESNGIQYQCLVRQSEGLAGIFQISSGGHRSVKFYSAGRLPEIAKWIMRDAANRKIVKQFLEPKLAACLKI